MAFSVIRKSTTNPPQSPAGGSSSVPPQGLLSKARAYLPDFLQATKQVGAKASYLPFTSPLTKGITQLMRATQNPQEKQLTLAEQAKFLPSTSLATIKQLGTNVGKAASFIPGGQVGKGIIDTASVALARKIMGDVETKTASSLRSQSLAKLTEARVKGNKELEQRMLKILQWQNNTSNDVIDDILNQAPSTRQVLASGVYAALTAAGGFTPGLTTGKLSYGAGLKAVKGFNAAKKLAKTEEALKGASFVKKLLYRYGFPVAKQGAIGGATFGALEATNKEATPQSIAKSTATGAAISGGITLAAIGLSDVIGATQKYVKPALVKKGKEIKTGLQNISAGRNKLNANLQKDLQTIGRLGETTKVAYGVSDDLAALPKQAVVGRVDDIASTIDFRAPDLGFGKVFRDKAALLKNPSMADLRNLASQTIDDLTSVTKDMDKGALALEKVRLSIGDVRSTKQKMADLALNGIRTLEKTKMRVLDRFAPIKKSWDTYRDARMYTSVADAKAEFMLKNLGKQLEPLDDIQDHYKHYLATLDYIDRAKAGLKTPGGQSLDDLQLALKTLVKEIGPDDMVRVEQARNAVNAYTRGLLQMRVDAGLISKSQMDAMLRAHPNYIPHNVLMAMDDEIVSGLTSSLNVAKTDLQAAVGSVDNIDDPFTALVYRTPIATRVAEKNKVLNSLIDNRDEFEGVVKLSEGAKAKKGFGTINLFANGKKETWQVPEDIAIAVKNLDTEPTPLWWKIFTAPTRWLKKGATQYNPSFFLPNKFRDEQTSILRGKALIESLAKQTGVSPQMVDMTDDQLRELYKLSGGYGSSIFLEGDDAKVWADITKKGLAKQLDTVNPLKVIQSVNERIEQSTRLEVFRKALERGLSPKDAAFASREATIDFAKMGTWMRPLNQAIPFLNARVQGFANIIDSAVKNPEAFARVQMYTGVYPTLLLHQWNRQFPSYQNISTYIKSKYWTIVTGETEGRDFNGNKILVPDFIAIPKGEGQSLVANPVQFYLERADGIDPRSVSEMLVDVLGSASPVSFQTFSRDSSIAGTLLSQGGPLFSIPAGWYSNVDPYTGQKIVPETRLNAKPEVQFTPYTPEIVKEAANIMGIAPAKLDFVINSFGGAPQDIVKTLDLIQGTSRGEVRINPLTPTPWGKAARLPLLRRFIKQSGESGSPLLEAQRKLKKGLEMEITTDKIIQNDVAEQIYQTLKTMENRQDRVNYLQSIQPQLTKDVLKRLEWLKVNRQTVEALRKYDSVEIRSQYIMGRLLEMKEQGVSVSERREFLRQLKKSKIYSDSISKRLKQISKDQEMMNYIRQTWGLNPL